MGVTRLLCLFGFLLACSANAQLRPGIRNPFWVAALVKSSTTVTPAWWDVETFANTDTDDTSGATVYYYCAVTVGSGSATKARIYLAGLFGNGNVKMALYPGAGGSPIASGSAAFTSGGVDDNAYKEVTFGSPVGVSAGTYILAWAFDSGNATFRYKGSSGNIKIKTGTDYATFPYDPLTTMPDFDLSRGYAVSVWVQ